MATTPKREVTVVTMITVTLPQLCSWIVYTPSGLAECRTKGNGQSQVMSPKILNAKGDSPLVVKATSPSLHFRVG